MGSLLAKIREEEQDEQFARKEYEKNNSFHLHHCDNVLSHSLLGGFLIFGMNSLALELDVQPNLSIISQDLKAIYFTFGASPTILAATFYTLDQVLTREFSFVDPNYRQMHLYSKLEKETIRIARENKLAIWFGVSAKNTKMQNVAKRLGYQPESIWYYKPYEEIK
jgi:hypothetical protein